MSTDDIVNLINEVHFDNIFDELCAKNEKFDNAMTYLGSVIKLSEDIKNNASDPQSIAVKASTMALVNVVPILRQGVKMKNISKEQWKEIGTKVKMVAVDLDAKDYSSLVFECWYAALSSSIESLEIFSSEKTIASIRDTLTELSEIIKKYKNEEIAEVKFIEDAELIALQAVMKILAAHISKKFSAEEQEKAQAIATYIYELGRYGKYAQEYYLLTKWETQRELVSEQLEVDYRAYLAEVDADVKNICALIDKAFDSDFKIAFDGSVVLAEKLGVNEEEILRNVEAIDDFFLN